MHRVFRRRMQAALASLRERIRPEWAEWAEPEGGYLIWLRLRPFPAGAHALSRALAERGVQASLGRAFFYSRTHETQLRLSIATLSEDEIVKGVKRLEAALRDLHSRRHT
jgi:DNA-binding transcriptional MocR family regulator